MASVIIDQRDMSEDEATRIVRECFFSALRKCEREFENGPEGVTLDPGEGALLWRMMNGNGMATDRYRDWKKANPNV